MWSNRRSAATAVPKSHARAFHASACSYGVCARAICEPLRRQTVDLTASLCTVSKTVRNDAVEST
eukprot:2656178-Lingulodinium_polyedra.AAC.1